MQDASGIAGRVATDGGIERQEQALETRVASYWETYEGRTVGLTVLRDC